jgi:hypothetical protein
MDCIVSHAVASLWVMFCNPQGVMWDAPVTLSHQPCHPPQQAYRASGLVP